MYSGLPGKAGACCILKPQQQVLKNSRAAETGSGESEELREYKSVQAQCCK
jgi:hypothetical protein